MIIPIIIIDTIIVATARERHPYLPRGTIPCHGRVGGGRGSALRGGDGPVIEEHLRGGRLNGGALTRIAALVARTGGRPPNTLTLLGFLGMAVAGGSSVL